MSFIHWSAVLSWGFLQPLEQPAGSQVDSYGVKYWKTKIKQAAGGQYWGWIWKNLWGASLLWFKLAISKREALWEMLDRMEESDLEKSVDGFPQVRPFIWMRDPQRCIYPQRCRWSSLRQATAAARLLWSHRKTRRRFICVICFPV